MSKKLYAAFLPLLAIAAFAVVPAAAQAQRVHACWENTAGGPCITGTETVHTRSDVVAGVPQPIVITDTNPSSPYYGVYASCIETDEGTVGTGGKDSITKTTFSSCTTNAPCTVTVAQSSAAWSTQAEKEGAAFFDTIKIEAGGLKITFTGGTECVSLTASGSVSQTWANRGTGEAGDSTFTNATGLTLFPPVDSTVVNGTIEVARSFSPLSKIFMS